MKFLIYFMLILLTATKCVDSSKDSSRKQLIKKMITYIQKSDTSQLYNLVDTAYFNHVYGEEDFIERINFLNSNFRECGLVTFDSIRIVTAGPTTEYILPLCRKADEIANKLVIGFADYKKGNKILFFDVRGNISEQDSGTLKKFVLPPTSVPQPKKQ